MFLHLWFLSNNHIHLWQVNLPAHKTSNNTFDLYTTRWLNTWKRSILHVLVEPHPNMSVCCCRMECPSSRRTTRQEGESLPARGGLQSADSVPAAGTTRWDIWSSTLFLEIVHSLIHKIVWQVYKKANTWSILSILNSLRLQGPLYRTNAPNTHISSNPLHLM